MRMIDGLFLTDNGTRKETNEDHSYIDLSAGIAIVADGMGGEKSGEVASRLAVDSLAGFLHEEISEGKRISRDYMNKTMQRVNRTVFSKTLSNPELGGMRSTIAAVVISGNTCIASNVGDSRAYLIRNGQLIKLTNDHSLVQEMIDHKLIPEGKARRHHLRHIVTSALGCSTEVISDCNQVEIVVGDRFLLCSDGLTEMLTDSEIAEVIASHSTSINACSTLIKMAIEQGGYDNITVGMGQFEL